MVSFKNKAQSSQSDQLFKISPAVIRSLGFIVMTSQDSDQMSMAGLEIR